MSKEKMCEDLSCLQEQANSIKSKIITIFDDMERKIERLENENKLLHCEISRLTIELSSAKQGEFIDVNTTLPEPMQKVIVLNGKCDSVTLGVFTKNGWSLERQGFGVVTHWAPIPVPKDKIW